MHRERASISRRAAAEALGAGLLLFAIVGSGIAADRLSSDPALTLTVNAMVTGLALAAAIVAVGPISGAHLNPAVTISVAMERGLRWTDVPVYVTAAIWFTSSTAFANPAVTVARILTDTFTGIAPADAAAFVLAQLVGAVAATLLFRWLVPGLPSLADDAVLTQPRD